LLINVVPVFFFSNFVQEEENLIVFNKQLGEDRRIVMSRSNLNELLKALEENELLCTDLYQVNTDGVILTKQSV
jgi:hypothetical protein